MIFKQVSVIDIAHVDAPEVIPSSLFEDRLFSTIQRLGLPPNLLQDVAGIEERRWWPEGVTPSMAAAQAAEAVIERSGIDRSEIGVLVNTSVCRDYIEPSTAALVHGSLGLSSTCLNFDLGNACLAFLNAMDLVGSLIERGVVKYGLIVDGENSRDVQEATLNRLSQPETDHAQFRKEFATLTLGSGSVAMLMGNGSHGSPHRYKGAVNLAATEWRHLCKGQVDFMETDTRTLLAEGVKLACQTFALAKEELGWSDERLDELVLHQVSAVHTRKLCEALGLNPDKAMLTFPKFGNVGPAAVPLTLSKAVASGRVKAGMRIGLLGIGSGLNCAMAEIEW